MHPPLLLLHVLLWLSAAGLVPVTAAAVAADDVVKHAPAHPAAAGDTQT
jgi:hypothetical protein